MDIPTIAILGGLVIMIAATVVRRHRGK